MTKFSQFPQDKSRKKQLLFSLGYSTHEIDHILFIAQYLDAFNLYGEFFEFRRAK